LNRHCELFFSSAYPEISQFVAGKNPQKPDFSRNCHRQTIVFEELDDGLEGYNDSDDTNALIFWGQRVVYGRVMSVEFDLAMGKDGAFH
jgi:hypothetical protein